MIWGDQPSRRVDNQEEAPADEVVQRLSQMPLFDVISDEDRARWADRFRRESHPRGDVLVRQNERPTAFYIVDRGELSSCVRTTGGEIPRAYFYAGDHFGETGLLTGKPWDATVEVLTDAELLVLDKADFDQMVTEYPEIGERLLELARQRKGTGRMRFEWQRPDEVTLLFSTKHWMALLHALRLPLLIAVVGLLSTMLYGGTGLGDLLAAILMVVAGTALAFAVLLAIYQFFDWRNDYYIITSLRVLHVERVLLLREERDEAPMERVQDVQVRQEGILANLLDFGDVIIQTAAATQRIVFSDIPYPDQVRRALFKPLRQAQFQERAEMRESIRQELGQRLNIPVATLEQEEEEQMDQVTGLAAGEEALEGAEAPPELLNWLRGVWRWLGDQFTFETWIISEGGNTITWRKNGWLLTKVSLLPAFGAITVGGLIFWSVSQSIISPLCPLLLFVGLVVIFGWWFYLYWDWQNDIYQVSGNRLIDLKKRPLFLEEMRRETTLDRVQNIGLSVPGPIAQVLNYGTVIIETAGETGAFRFEHVHDPRGVQSEIFSRWESYTRSQRDAERNRRYEEMGEWFEIYEELKQKQGTR